MNMNDAGVNIHVRIEPSRIMLGFLISIHLVAMIALWQADLQLLMSAALTLAILCYGVYSYSRFYRLTHARSVRTLRLEGTNWQLEMSDARQLQVSLVNEMVIFSWFIAVQFKEIHSSKKYPVALFRDSADKDEQRRLRVWLMHGVQPDQPL
jgi:hypothetical protein